MPFQKPVLRVAVISAVVAVLLAVGGANGVGPLAHVTPPDEVTDPKEMLARSLQAVIDATSVHLEATLAGHAPGALFGRQEAQVTVDGSTASIDARPQDARTRAHVESAPFAISLDIETTWDSLYTRTSADGPWTKGSVGVATQGTGLDLNPLTLVDRLRAWLGAPGTAAPTEQDVACAAPSGRCHEIRLDAGNEPTGVLIGILPGGRTAAIGPATTTLVLRSDAQTLRPANVRLTVASADGTVNLVLNVDATAWDEPSVIEEPPLP
jgi:hypothetical protein